MVAKRFAITAHELNRLFRIQGFPGFEQAFQDHVVGRQSAFDIRWPAYQNVQWKESRQRAVNLDLLINIARLVMDDSDVYLVLYGP